MELSPRVPKSQSARQTPSGDDAQAAHHSSYLWHSFADRTIGQLHSSLQNERKKKKKKKKKKKNYLSSRELYVCVCVCVCVT